MTNWGILCSKRIAPRFCRFQHSNIFRQFSTGAASTSAVPSLKEQEAAGSEFVPEPPPPPPTPNRAEVKRTPLYDLHKKYGGKLVDFAGYSLPVYYQDASISDSHLWTRKHASIFDVSHMQQVAVRGNDRFEFIESITLADLTQMVPNTGAYSLMLNDSGGIIDDLILMNCESRSNDSWRDTRLQRMLSLHPTATRTIPSERVDDNHLFIVLNAACAVKDLTHIMNKLEHFHSLKSGADVTVEPIEERALIALQGPESAAILRTILEPKYVDQFDKLYFMHTMLATVAGVVGCRVTRCGYTGEDGVEISVDASAATELTEALLESSNKNNNSGGARLAGLGARDSLRLEAGLCLYGNDIAERTTPVEAGLMWTISKRRRAAKDYAGADVVAEQMERKNFVQVKRVGLIQAEGTKRGPAFRAGNRIVTSSDDQNSNSNRAGDNNAVIGRITSGAPSPSLGINVAMAYVGNVPQQTQTGAKLSVLVGGGSGATPQLAQVAKLPFVPHRYYLPPKK